MPKVAGERTLIRTGQTIDGTGAVHERASVLLEGSTIAAVLPSGSAPPSDAAIIDASTKTVMPGLIACHEHLTFMNTYGEYLKVVEDDSHYLTLRCVKS